MAMPKAKTVRREVVLTDALVQERASEMYDHGSYDLSANARAMVIAEFEEVIDAHLRELTYRLLSPIIQKHVVYRSSKKERR